MANKNKNENLVDISSNKQVRKLYKKKGRGLRVVTLVLSILMLLTGSAFVGLNLYLETHRKFEGDYTYMKDDASGKQTANTGNTVTLKTSDLLQNSKVLNIMLFGEDNKLDEEFGRTDTIIMLSIDNVHKKLKMTSFQRDTYVYIPGHGYERINASYSLGGAALTIKTIQANFGVKIDRYAVVDFDSFKDIIDTLGGVEMEVTKDEIDYINYQMYKNGQSKGNRTTITAKPGLVKLNGQEALWYSRNRGLTIGEDGNEIGISGDDWDRTARQRKLLTKMVHDLKGAGLSEIIAIVNEIGPKITTNLKKDEIMGLVTNALTYIDYDIVQNYVPSEKLWYYNGPGDESYEVVGSCILVTDMEAQRKELAQFIYEDLVK
ncbi:MAG: LCP family protein [Ruminococcus sp.]|jgi:LCP family protein required for cell wall assembly|nr:LCP family protein [Ruminococcus sp.]MBQ5687503.1 LCP family protein [Ruminococcus sp.]MBQ5744934.1 LCP family protein [Ruminococcus sp.]